MKHLIIGNGIAGVNAAEAIRELDHNAEIIMVGDEAVTPYSRPMIANVLEGTQVNNKLAIRPNAFYRENGIQDVLGHRVDRLDVEGHRIQLTDGRWLGFDRLLIATGADPRPIKADGMDLNNVFYMRTEAHARQQVRALSGARKALVIGGGLVAIKAAKGLLKRGLKITMLIPTPYPLALQVNQRAGEIILQELRNHGLDVRVSISVIGFEGNGKVVNAVTTNGSDIPCDVVIIGEGVRPALEFIPRNLIDVDFGVLVDSYMRTSHPDIYAAGDVAEATDIARQVPWVNAIWPEAAAQGRVAGANMAGRPVAYPGSLSRNVIRIFDLDIMTIGDTNPASTDGIEILQSENKAQHTYRHLVFREDKLVGAVLINHFEQGGVIRALIENQIAIGVPRPMLLSAAFNFCTLEAISKKTSH